LEYDIRRVQVNYNGLKLNGTHQLLLYADGINIMGESVHTIEGNTGTLVVAGKETGIDVNADNTRYVVASRDHNARRSHSIKNDNSSFESVEEFLYLGTAVTHQNSVQEGIKDILKSGNACYY